jgi:hypothetical protein
VSVKPARHRWRARSVGPCRRRHGGRNVNCRGSDDQTRLQQDDQACGGETRRWAHWRTGALAHCQTAPILGTALQVGRAVTGADRAERSLSTVPQTRCKSHSARPRKRTRGNRSTPTGNPAYAGLGEHGPGSASCSEHPAHDPAQAHPCRGTQTPSAHKRWHDPHRTLGRHAKAGFPFPPAERPCRQPPPLPCLLGPAIALEPRRDPSAAGWGMFGPRAPRVGLGRNWNQHFVGAVCPFEAATGTARHGAARPGTASHGDGISCDELLARCQFIFDLRWRLRLMLEAVGAQTPCEC